MLKVTSRLNDALWSLRREFGMGSDLDRLRKPILFEWDMPPEKVDDLFTNYPKRVPADYKAALLDRIQEVIRLYWAYINTKKGFHRLWHGILFLENVARCRAFEGCQLVHDKNTGYRLELKPGYPRKK